MTDTLQPGCVLSLVNAEKVQEKVKMHESGGTVLIEYSLFFNEAISEKGLEAVKPNTVMFGMENDLYRHRPSEWKRVFSRHGYALLSLPFNYKLLSFYLLSFGVASMDVEVQDYPLYCFDSLTEEERMNKTRNLVLFNFHHDSVEISTVADNNFVCHMKLKSDGSHDIFSYECCTKTKNLKEVRCTDYESNSWVNLLFSVIEWMDFLFFLLAPMFFLGAISGRSFKTTNYIVRLGENCVLRIKKDFKSGEALTIPEPSVNKRTKIASSMGMNKEARDMKRKYVEHLRKVPADKVTTISQPVLHVLIDHKKLMSVKDVNVGILPFIWSNVFMCKIRRSYPFTHCCKVSICGSWGKRFFCFLIPRCACVRSMQRLNIKLKRHLSWQNVLQCLALFVILFMIPLPFYVRTLVFYLYEHEVVSERLMTLKSNNVTLNPIDNFFFYFRPLHPLFIYSMASYIVFSIMLLILSRKNKMMFVDYMVAILRDFKHLDRLQVFRMMALHLIMPFEKFGLLGLLIGPFMWIFTLPLGILTIMFYLVPTLYLSGRLIFLRKPKFLNYIFLHGEKKYDDPESVDTVGVIEPKDTDVNDDNIRTVNKMLLLQNISPPTEAAETPTPLKEGGFLTSSAMFHFSDRAKRIIGVFLTLWMWSVLILYAEFFGFLIEIMTLTFMGAIVNAGSAGQFFILIFLTVTYALTVLNKVEAKYKQLAAELFDHIQGKLKDQLDETVIIRGSEQKNFAFKFFSKQDLRGLNAKRQLSILSDVHGKLPDVYNEKLKRKEHKLHITLHSVVLFLDKWDCPRIPKRLFQKVCQIKCPGCPGPIHENLFVALKELSYMVLFIFFVLIVVMAFGDAYEISTTNQLLLTVVGGFAPFVVRVILKPKQIHVDFSTYAFKGKVHEVISEYFESWPVFDMEFDVMPEKSDMLMQDGTSDEPPDVDHEVALEPKITTELSTPLLEPVDKSVLEPKVDTSLSNPPPESVNVDECEPVPKASDSIPLVEVSSPGMSASMENPMFSDTCQLYKLDVDQADADLVLCMKHGDRSAGNVNNCVIC